jgi:ATP/maltotriose-dependent transcriptional regulator MalT
LRHLPARNQVERAALLELTARAASAAGAHARASAAAADLETIASEMAVAPLRASASAAAGLAAGARGEDDLAQRKLEDAVDLFTQSAAPFEAARSRLDLALVLARLGQTDAARDEVRRAIRVLSSVDATFELGRARSLESTLAAKPASRRLHSLVRALTAREIDVIRLIADGHSNRRIGQRLFISDHTVHRHVANILNKLDVRSRSAIVAKAAALGVLLS